MGPIMRWLDSLPLWQLGILLIILFISSALLGRLLRKMGHVAEKETDPGLIVSSTLGLMALLLGFTVSMAVGRYDGRKTATLVEANAIGTFVYRTDLLPPETRTAVQATLSRYIDARLAVGAEHATATDVAEAERLTVSLQGELWRQLLAAGAGMSDGQSRLLYDSANEMFDMGTARSASLANRLPPTLILLLFFFPCAILVLIGYINGDALGSHLIASIELVVLLALVLLLIADLNTPRSGSILVPETLLLDVKDQLQLAQARPATPVIPPTQ